MLRFDTHRWLPALALLAGIVASPGSSQADDHAQNQAQTPAPAQPNPQPAPLQPAPPQTTVHVPADPPTPEQLGDSLVMHQRYQAAIAAYANAPQDSAAVLNKLGIAYQMMRNSKDAIRCYKASLKISPNSPRVINNLGTVYDSLQQYAQAERMYRKALKLDPQSALILKNLGSDLLAQHNFRKGAEAYKQALAIDPNIFQDRTSLRVENPASAHDRGAINYYMARGCAHSGLTDCAIQYLRMALNEGFTTPKKLAVDSDFASLRELPAFKQLLAAQSAP